MSNPKIKDIYPLKERILSYLTGVILGTLVALPFIVLAINILILYIYFYYVVTFMLLITLIGWVIIMDLFYFKTLMEYKRHPQFNHMDRFIKQSLITSGGILLLGGIVIITVIPHYI